jgi:ribosomal protein L6P/L9E
MNYKTKTLSLSSDLEFFFLNFEVNAKTILLLKKKASSDKLKYYILPDFIQFEKLDGALVFKINSCVENSTVLLNNFFLSFLKWLKSFEKPLKKKLILKGLGFRASVLSSENILELKLGFSHIIKIAIPVNELSVKVDKNTLIVEGADPVKIGNFVTYIRNLKFPDSYKGKGFWYKNETITLKEIKKT